MRPLRRFTFALLFASLSFTACPKHDKPDAGAPESKDAATSVDAGPVDAGPWTGLLPDGGAPAMKIASIELTLLDGGTQVIENPGSGEQAIDSAIGVVVHLPVQLKDFRLRVMDGADQVMPSDDQAGEGDAGVDYTIMLAHSLKPSKSYTVLLDAQNAANVTDVDGHPWQDVELHLKVNGEPEPEPTGGHGKKHHH